MKLFKNNRWKNYYAVKKRGLVLHQPDKKYYLKFAKEKSSAPKLNKVIKHILGGFA